jgi:hypothetical protein
MDWKSTAVISGVGVLATWFYSMPAIHSPATGAIAPAARPAETAVSTIDIQREADRLQVRVHQVPQYVETSRNPFRFGARPAPAARPSGTSGPAPAAPVVPPPAPPSITLDGIATDVVDGQAQRTAILKTEAGVVLVREGEEVAGQFRVGKIASDAIELVKISDGSVLRLALR